MPLNAELTELRYGVIVARKGPALGGARYCGPQWSRSDRALARVDHREAFSYYMEESKKEEVKQ